MERKLSKIYTPYLIIICIIYLIGTSTANTKDFSPSLENPIKVIDGDSIEIGKTRIRLMGIDAPEYLQTCKDNKNKPYPCGKEARKYLEKLINKASVTCKSHKKDQYDRELCTCYAGETDINAAMVKSGNAIVYLESIYQEKQQYAKLNKKGIWSGKFIHPRLFRILKEQEKKRL